MSEIDSGRLSCLSPEPKNTAGVEHLLTAQQVAGILGVRHKRVHELGIPSIRVPERQLRWRPDVLKAWIEAREV